MRSSPTWLPDTMDENGQGFSPFRVAGFRPAPPVSAWLTPLTVWVVARGAGVRDGQCHGDGEYPSAAWCSCGGPGLGYGTCRPSAVGLSVADVPLVQGPEALGSVHREVAGHGSGVRRVRDVRAGRGRMTSAKIVWLVGRRRCRVLRRSPLILMKTSSRCHVSPGRGWGRRSALAYCCPNFPHQRRTVSYETITPHSSISSSTSRNDSGKRWCSHTQWEMTSTGYRCPFHDRDASSPTDTLLQPDQLGDHPTRQPM